MDLLEDELGLEGERRVEWGAGAELGGQKLDLVEHVLRAAQRLALTLHFAFQLAIQLQLTCAAGTASENSEFILINSESLESKFVLETHLFSFCPMGELDRDRI